MQAQGENGRKVDPPGKNKHPPKVFKGKNLPLMEKELKVGIARSQRSENAEINQKTFKSLAELHLMKKTKEKKIAGDTKSC